MVRVSIPATTANLGPGFDCLGLALSLYNHVEMSVSSTWHIEVKGEGQGSLALDSSNLVWQAACRLWKEQGVLAPPVKVTLHNNIPLARGLGSSSAAIVGGLMAANAYLVKPLSLEQLLDIATQIEGHPDNVAPALYGGLVASLGTGGQVYAESLPLCSDLKFVVCIPGFHLPTALARKALPAQVPHHDAVFNVSRAVLLVQALKQGNVELLRLACEDKLHQPYRQHLIPGFSDIATKAYAKGAAAVMISGAGPSILAISDKQNTDDIGAVMEEEFAKQGITSRALALLPCNQGAFTSP